MNRTRANPARTATRSWSCAGLGTRRRHSESNIRRHPRGRRGGGARWARTRAPWETSAAGVERRARSRRRRRRSPGISLRAAHGSLVVDQRRPDDPADERVDREGERRRQQRLDDDLAQDEQADGGVDAEHQVKDGEPGGPEQRQAAGEHRRHVAARDLEALAVAAGEVADRKQDERADPERLQQDGVEHEAGGEARDRADDPPAEQAERDDHDGDDVRRRAEDAELREEGDLDDHRHQQQRREPDRHRPGDDHCGTPGRSGPPVITWTYSRPRRSANGPHVHALARVDPGALGLGHRADRDPRRIGGGELRGRPPGRDQDLALLDRVLALDVVEDEVVGVAELGLDDPLGPLLEDLSGDRRLVVGDQLDHGGAAGDLADAADEAVAGDHRVVHRDPGAGPLAHRHRRVPDRARRGRSPAPSPPRSRPGPARRRSGCAALRAGARRRARPRPRPASGAGRRPARAARRSRRGRRRSRRTS